MPTPRPRATTSPRRPHTPRVHLISLGCPKNRVDSELMLGALLEAGAVYEERPARADFLIVNTCAFITPAVEESIEAILELARAKKRPGQKLIVTGCLVERHKDDLVKELPEVDHFFGTGAVARIAELLQGEKERLVLGTPGHVAGAEQARALTGSPYTAYLKITEGCGAACAFCIIPRLRGKPRSRAVADVVEEACALKRRGVRELILVGQDTSAYGLDRKDGASLLALLREPELAEGAHWLRLHYFYPARVTAELIAAMREAPAVVPYVDMPIQHICSDILKRMNRRDDEASTRRAIESVRREWPDAVLRTSVIVGFPGETPEHFSALLRLVEEGTFDGLGAFAFSPQDGTRAARYADAIPEEVKAERVARLMEAQQAVSRARLAARRGQVLPVLVEGPSAESELLLAGRFGGQAPDIDGVTYITRGHAPIGSIVPIRITDSHDYDLVGHVTRVAKNI